MSDQKLGLKESRKGERGSILVVSTVGMLSLLLAVGLGVDISRLYLAKTELQNAADAAALAAVSGLNGTPGGITEAANRAVQAMNKYDFNKTGVSFPRENVLFAVNLEGDYVSEALAFAEPTNIRFVQVTTATSAIGVSFAKTVLGNTKDLSATATAGYSVPLNEICGWIPVFVLDIPGNPISPGNTYTFRLDAGDHISPGNYQLLSPLGPGGSDTRTGLANGVNLCIGPGAEVQTKTGMTAGDVRQGLNTRFDIYQGPVDPVVSPPDANVALGANYTYRNYLDGVDAVEPDHDGTPGRRVVYIPLTKNPPGEGRDSIIVDRFGVFFLRTPVGNGNGGELVAEYVEDKVLTGRGGFNPDGGPANNQLAVPVLYK
jgi:Flp pilus assembly protein TadG